MQTDFSIIVLYTYKQYYENKDINPFKGYPSALSNEIRLILGPAFYSFFFLSLDYFPFFCYKLKCILKTIFVPLRFRNKVIFLGYSDLEKNKSRKIDAAFHFSKF